MNEYRICNRCVMDTSDSEIEFDEKGICNHCTQALKSINQYWTPDKEKFESLMCEIKKNGVNKAYDCIIGISGGIDSSYLAYLCSKAGLRMLGVHIDAGWNTEVSNYNINLLCDKLGIDLKVIKIDQEEMMDLQRAYFKAEVINQDVPQDHAFFASLYAFAIKHKIKYFLSGGNYASESILPQSWVFNSNDCKNLLSIHKKYGKVKLKTYPIMNFFDYYFKFPYVHGLKKIRPLNLIQYNTETALSELHNEIGFQYYGAKHCESLFTRFYMAYYLPKKFGIDKRRCHLSSLIVAGQMTRETAIKIIEKPLCTDSQIEQDINAYIDAIHISKDEFIENMNRFGGASHYTFKSQKNAIRFKNFVKGLFR